MNLGITKILIFLSLCVGVGNNMCIGQSYSVESVPNPKQNKSNRYVSNPDHILSGETENKINEILTKLEDSTTVQVAVVCLNSIGELVSKDFATALFRKWGLGYQQKNNGLLILLIKDVHRIEMETGYGLEGVLPDAVCKRIQTEKMIPLAKNDDLDGAIISGVEEIERLITEPGAAKEVNDKSKYTANQRLDDSGVFVLFILLIPGLLLLRGIRFLTKKRNPISDQLEKTISKARLRIVRAILFYAILPLCLGFAVIASRTPLSLHGWHIMSIIYGYMILVAWDARRRRGVAFAGLFEKLTEPEQYSRRKAVRFNSWDNIIFYPIPFAWLKITDDRVVNALRDHPRQAEGANLIRLSGEEKNAFLNDYQKVEEAINTVDYDVWRNEEHHVTEVVGYENLSKTDYEKCEKCASRAMHLVNDRILSAATTEREGRGVKEYACEACGRRQQTQYNIKKVTPTISSNANSSTTYSASGSSSSWGGSSSGSSSGSSWGGGSSGGGGAGSSW